MKTEFHSTLPMQCLQQKIDSEGFGIAEDLFSADETARLQQAIAQADNQNPSFRLGKDLFAIRHLLHEIPALRPLLSTEKFKNLVRELMGNEAFIVKAIFFDKPPLSNWVVNWHQDLTISVKDKIPSEGFSNWTLKAGEHCVQPPFHFLESILTFRIHLDDCTAENGAVKVIPGSHRHGVLSDQQVKEATVQQEAVLCTVKKGGIHLMKPLLLHASAKSTSQNHRRVIHLELSSLPLPAGMRWREQLYL